MYRTIENRHVLYDYNYPKRNSMTNNILKVTFNLEYKTIDIPILFKMGYYSAPPPLACTGGGCYITTRGVIQY